MTMKHLFQNTEEYRGKPEDTPDFSGYVRLSPVGMESYTELDPYRCPVSTPTINARNSLQVHNKPPSFVTFASMNRSLQIPKNISSPSHSKYKLSKSSRPVAKAQKKNFDCYFVRNVNKSAYIDAQSQATWLSSLCSQPVNEIFGKYQRRSEGLKLTQQASRSGNSTPGEKALMSAWSSNASNRGASSVLSKSTKSGPLTTPQSSRLSFADPYLRVNGCDSDPDRITINPGFGLMPVSPTNEYTDEGVISPRASPVFHKVFRNNVNQTCMDLTPHIHSDMYSAYQRDKRFPEIRPRKSTFSPTRKRVVSESREPMTMTLSYPSRHQDLEESPMHIISIGKGPRDSTENLKDSTPLTPSVTSVPKPCSFRLPKAHHMSLTELHGTG